MRIFKILSLVLLVAVFVLPAPKAAEAKRVSLNKSYSSRSNPKYAAIVINADTGKILHKENATSLRHPASLTKMMTLYLTFEALKNSKLRMNQRLRISAEAASRPQTNLSLKKGQTIKVRDAVLGLIVRSANDAAVVLAEALGGSERNFAKKMTYRAKQLGMKKTTFRNASGLHDPKQVSTAKDMAILSVALRKHYPQYYHYFSRTQFSFRGKLYKSHNDVVKTYPGADGLKTGYIRASGFNLATSARRGNDRIIGVVLGGRKSKSRDKRMVQLLDKSFIQIANEKGRSIRSLASTGLKKPFIPYPVSKSYRSEGGYESYAAATNFSEIEPASKPAKKAPKRVLLRQTIAAVPYPKEKPRFLAKR